MSDIFYLLKLFYHKDKRNFIVFCTTSFLTAPILFSELFATKHVVDIIQNNNDYSYQYILSAVILLMLFLYIGSTNSSLKAISSTNLTITSIFELENSILMKTSRLALADIEDPLIKTKREMAKRLSLFGLLDQWTGFIVNLLTLITIIVVLSYYGFYYLVIIVCFVLILQLYIIKWASRKVENITQNQTSSVRVINYLVEILVSRSTIQEVRTYGMHHFLYNKLKNIFFKNFKQMQKKVILFESVNLSQNIINTLLNGVTITVLVVVLGGSSKSAGLFVILFQIINQLFILIPSIIKNFSELAVSRMRYKEYMSYMMLKEPETLDGNSSIRNNNSIQVQVNNLSFRYNSNSSETLKNINLTINSGERIAFVGDNGSGKTTLVKLILGLYNPTKGIVEWVDNGIVVNNRVGNIRVVFQDFIKLYRPIRENIALGNIEKINEDSNLKIVLEKAEADQFATNLDTLLGPQFGGNDLSGGQWQKLALARAYLNEGNLTIFDEPTAALDPYSEQKAFETFVKLGDKKTSIIVTHRLYMAKFVDRIYLFENGEIVECGTHQELIDKKGKYEKMYTLQSSLYL
ncbi:ABC transporter ATP-binding protein [Paenibacillus motobuensis]|uniref:ABC transporter ATP-binding protein n=1 Tax=Paenibacillus motobuensis TaxID=295324 RepID=A0ABP3HWY5_9BACL